MQKLQGFVPAAIATALTLALSAAPAMAAGSPAIVEHSQGITASAATDGIGDITAGPDGNLWFTYTSQARLGRMTPAGAVTEFDVPQRLSQITSLPGGSLYAIGADGTTIYRIGTDGQVGDTPLHVPTPALGDLTQATSIAPGADGRLWIGLRQNDLSQPNIAAVDADLSGYEAYHANLPGANGFNVVDLVSGPGGALWYITANSIGSISTDGATKVKYNNLLGGRSATSIAAGPDGNLWVLEAGTDCTNAAPGCTPVTGAIARVSPAGALTTFPRGDGKAFVASGGQRPEITTGADGNLWFGEPESDRIGRVATADGTISEFSAGITAGSAPLSVAGGADHGLWFTESRGGGRVARAQVLPVDATAPTILIATPADGGSYTTGQGVSVQFSCTDELGGSGMASCTGTQPLGSAADMSTGTHTFTVTAVDNAGNTATKTSTYTVSPPPVAGAAKPTTAAGTPVTAGGGNVTKDPAASTLLTQMLGTGARSAATTLKGSHLKTILSRGSISLRFSAPATGTLFAAIVAGDTPIGSVTRKVVAGDRPTLKLKLTKPGRALLTKRRKAHRSVSVTVGYQFAATDGSAGSGTANATIKP